jgi:hypothetical protein
MVSIKKLFIHVVFCCTSVMAFAQSSNSIVAGKVVDITQQPLEMATIALLRPADSSLAYFGVTGKDGHFQIKNVASGNYVFQAAYIGHTTVMFRIEVANNLVQPSLATIVLEAETNVLSEIIIEGQRIPIIINRDTVSYNTSAFQVRSDETAEDLLRRLPGIDVDARGKITAQGEEVKKVLVDGKEFFGGNVQLVTQNLPADAIKNVKVYDRESDDAMYTGVADGARTKTIDLELKDDKKNGYFGDVEAGIGTDERYRAKGGLHMFSPKTRFSALTNNNNLNQYGFNWSDMMAMAGNEGGGYISWDENANPIPMSFMGPSEGIFSSTTNGLNLNFDPNKKHMLNANYYLTYYDHLQTTQTQSEEFNNTQSVQFNENRTQRNLQLEHRAYIEYRWDVDSANRLHLRSSLNTVNRNNRGFFESNGRTQEGSVLQSSQQFGNTLANRLSGRTSIQHTKKFKKPRRNLATSLATTFGDDVTDESYQATNDFPLQQQASFLYQLREDRELRNTYTGSIKFNDGIKKHHNLGLKLDAAQNRSQQERFVRDVGGLAIIDSLSPQNLLVNNNVGAHVMYSFREDDENAFSFGSQLSLRNYWWQLQFPNGIGKMAPKQQLYLLPEIWVQYSEGSIYSYVNADREVRLPGLFQLIENPDLRNPLNVVAGNLDLMPEVSNSVDWYFRHYNQNTQHSISGSMDFSRTQNPFVYAQTVDENFRRVSQVINGDDPNNRFSSNMNTRVLIEKAKVFWSTGITYRYNDFNAPINGVLNRQINHAYGVNVGLSNSKKQKLDVNITYAFNYNQSRFGVFENLNQDFSTQNARVNIMYRLGKKWTFSGEFQYQYFSEQAFAGAVGIPLLNSVITYRPKEQSNWTFKLNAFDVLNQNQSITRMANANFIRQVENNLLTRYFLVSAIYKIKKK